MISRRYIMKGSAYYLRPKQSYVVKTMSVVREDVRQPISTAVVTRPIKVEATAKIRPSGDLGVLSP